MISPGPVATHVVGCGYGETRTGKTTTMVADFIGLQPLFIGVAGQSTVLEAAAEHGLADLAWAWPLSLDRLVELGVDVDPHGDEPTPVDNLDELMDLLLWLVAVRATMGERFPFGAVCVDDISQLTRVTLGTKQEEAKLPQNLTLEGKVNKFFAYGELASTISRFAPLFRYLRLPFWCTAHELPHAVNAETRQVEKGCADFGSRPNAGRVTGWFSTMVRYVKVSADEWPDPFGGYFLAEADAVHATWLHGDKRGAFGTGTPISIREALRFGRTPTIIPRLAGMEWQDEVADMVVNAILSQAGDKDPTLPMMQEISHQVADIAGARWVDLSPPSWTDHARLAAFDVAFRQVRRAIQDGHARWAFMARRQRNLTGLVTAKPRVARLK